MVQHKQISVIPHENKMKDESHTIISIDAEKVFDKVQRSFTIKALEDIGG